jgi:uncharacterized membrane protein YtjA (UPF0391 family)
MVVMSRPGKLFNADVAAGNGIQQGVKRRPLRSNPGEFYPSKRASGREPVPFPEVRGGISKDAPAARRLEELAVTLLKWALIFLVVSIIAGILGFTGVSAASADIARFLFYVFVVIFLVLLILGLTIFRV